ncbi:MAG: type II secretion system F family protein [Pirellulales bacterium]|nr:type II secretion system F family protein [Pirellulales bacterium]
MTATEFKESPLTDPPAKADGTDTVEMFSGSDRDDDFSWKSDDIDRSSWEGAARSIHKQDIAEITSQLAIMTRSGVDVATALASLANQCQRPALAEVLADVHESVLAGNSLSSAMRQHAEVFEPTFIATVAAGEASGRMAEVLRQLASVQRGEIRSRRTMKALLTYPILLMAVSSSVVVALVLVVLPRFSEIFTDYDISLPVITQILLAVASEFRSRWWLWVPLIAATLGGTLAWRKTAGGRRQLDALWLQLPVISNVYRSQLVGRMCRLFGLMLDSGVPLLDVLRLTKEAVGNVHYKDLVHEMQEAVVNGRSLASALQEAEIVPKSAREMLITAEGTGSLGEVTQLLGEYYEEEAEARMRQVVGLLEPVITIVMGVVVAIVVLAVMLPVFDLSTLASR